MKYPRCESCGQMLLPENLYNQNGIDHCKCGYPVPKDAFKSIGSEPVNDESSSGNGATIQDSVIKNEGKFIGRDNINKTKSNSSDRVNSGDGATFQDTVAKIGGDFIGRDNIHIKDNINVTLNIGDIYVTGNTSGASISTKFKSRKKLGDSELESDSSERIFLKLKSDFENPELLYEGSKSFIIKATEKKASRLVVLKISKKRMRDLDEYFINAWKDSIERINQSPYIVRIFRLIGNIVVLEYMEKGSLQNNIPNDGYEDLSEAFQIMKECALGVQEIHKLGVVHLDIKPSNILLNSKGEAKLADFGISREIMLENNVDIFKYLNIDILPDDEETKRSFDIYRLGLSFVSLMTGNLSPNSVTWEEIKSKLIDRAISETVVALIQRMISKESQTRPKIEDVVSILNSQLNLISPSTVKKPKLDKDYDESGVVFQSFVDIRISEWNDLKPQLTSLPNWSQNLITQINNDFSSEIHNWASRYLTQDGHIPNWLKENNSKGSWITNFFKTADRQLCYEWIISGLLNDDPEWFVELILSRNADIARVFLLHGNINDYFFDPERGYVLMKDFFQREFNNKACFYSLSQGIKGKKAIEENENSEEISASHDELWIQVKKDFECLDKEFRSNSNYILIINYIDKLFPQNIADLEREFLVEMILRWAVDTDIPTGNSVILTTTNYEGLHPDLKSRINKIHSIEVKRPEIKSRLKYLLAKSFSTQGNARGAGRTRNFVGRIRFSTSFGQSNIQGLRSFAHMTAGLNCMGIEDMILRAIRENGGLIESSQVSRHKRNLISGESAGLLEIIEPRYSFKDVGGLEKILVRLKEICSVLRSSDPKLTSIIPMGILFLGPPGTGKTLVAESLAGESGLTFVKLGNFRDMYVGQSEKNMSLALQLLKSLSPVVVFIDEIDQAIMQREEGSESGPEKRIFAKLLEFMSDTALRGQVLWIGASNIPSKLDDALKRAGRFDLKLPFFLPEQKERENILKIKLNSQSLNFPVKVSDQELHEIGRETEGYSGAELQVLISEAVRFAVGENRQQEVDKIQLTKSHFEKAIQNYDPSESIKKYKKIQTDIIKDIPFKDLL